MVRPPFSFLFVVVEKRSGYLTIDFVLLNPYRFWGALIAEAGKDLFNKRCGKL